jgi:hypothetical protein
MYCTHCNHPNPEGNKFCESCGKPLAIRQQVIAPPPVSQSTIAAPSQTSWARRLASIGSAIVLYCFFLPWILVSCSLDVNNQAGGVEVSGYEIASGDYKFTENLNQLGTLFGGNPYQTSNTESAYPLLAVIPLLGAIGLISLNGRISGSIAAILSGLLGIGGMAIFSLVAVAYGEKLNQEMLLQLHFRGGFWGTWFGFIWLVIVAIMTVRQRR